MSSAEERIAELERENAELRKQLNNRKTKQFFVGAPKAVLTVKKNVQQTRTSTESNSKKDILKNQSFRIAQAAKLACIKREETNHFSEQLMIPPLPESPFSDEDLNELHKLLTENISTTIRESTESARQISSLCSVKLSESFSNFATQLRHVVRIRESQRIGKDGVAESAPGALRLAEEAQVVLSGALMDVSNVLKAQFQELAQQYSERGENFVNVEVKRLEEIHKDLFRLRSERDSKLKACVESAGVVKKNSDRKARLAQKKSQDAASSCCDYEMARFKYTRRANHLAMAAANDITGRTAELVDFLMRFFDHAALLMRRVGPELQRVRELTMKAMVHSVNDDGIWIDRIDALKKYFEKHDKTGLPNWDNKEIYELPRRDHLSKMFLNNIQDSIQMGWLLKVATSSFPGRSRWRRRWFWIDMRSGKLRYLWNNGFKL